MKNIIQNCLLGIIAFCIAFSLAFLVTNDNLGVRIDKNLLPDAAKLILDETPNEPLTQDQFKRLRKASKNSEAFLSPQKLLFKELRSSWYWFILIPGLMIFCKFIYKKLLHWSDVILITLPSLVLLSVLIINV